MVLGEPTSSWRRRYASAVIAPVVTAALAAFVQTYRPIKPGGWLLLVIFFVSWTKGWKPGAVSTAVSWLVLPLLTEQAVGLIPLTFDDFYRIGILLAAVGIGHWMGLPRRRQEAWLRDQNAELERRVAERTAELIRINQELEQEVAERRRAQEELARNARELQRSNADLHEFACVASHDLQEPLRMVISYLSLFARRYESGLEPEAREYLQVARQGAIRMHQLIGDLLRYSRAGSEELECQPVNCESACRQAVANLKTSIEECKAKIAWDPLPYAMANESLLTQVFQNLIGNAIKFRGSQPPEIRITAKQAGGEWIFSVADNGIGVDPAHADKIFVIFQRLHSRDQHEGTGVGLALCKRIIERHGGRIWVDPAPDSGSIFRFTLPAAAKPSKEGEAPGVPISVLHGSRPEQTGSETNPPRPAPQPPPTPPY